jgi:beta-glucosidase
MQYKSVKTRYYVENSLEYEANMEEISALLSKLTLEEKTALLEGVDCWNTNPIPQKGVPSLFLTDGPHGLRKVNRVAGGFGVADNEHSTAFPTSATVASSWNPENAYRMGQAIAEECVAAGVNVLLAPGINIKRSPLCGRNFEYYSEDPLLSGEFGAAFVQGVQSMGIGCSVKHFAANSNENYRFVGDSVVDERALREIYLRAFEQVVREAKPYTVMCSYNRLNGTTMSQNREMLTDLLRGEWGFDGAVVTDWGAARDRVSGVKAGCDLDMPGDVAHNRNALIEAVKSGALPEKALDCSVDRMLRLTERCSRVRMGIPYDEKAHAGLSCRIAEDSAVLLKNDGILPLNGEENLLVVGEMFEKLRYQGAGSSLIDPPDIITPQNAFDRRKIRYRYRKGYRCFYTERNPALEQEALEAAGDSDVILFFGGLSDFEESEGFDRPHMRLGGNQTALLDRLLKTGKKVVLVMYAGAPVELPFFENLSGLLNMYLPGMYGGEATTALLYGEISPSGKLAESWPLRAESSSCAADYDRGPVSRYYESIYVGYRFYDRAKTKLRFPFGYGLSYTSFTYRNMSVERRGDSIAVTAEIANAGGQNGAEAVQLYVKNAKSRVFKPEKELRAFTKVFLNAGETKKVEMKFARKDLAFWNAKKHAWVLENGRYEICLAASCDDVRLSAPLEISDGEKPAPVYSEAVSKAYALPPKEIPACFGELLDRQIPEDSETMPLTMESSLLDFRRTFAGKILYASVMNTVRKDYRKALKMPDSPARDARLKNTHFVVKMMPYNSIRSMCMSSGGQFQYHTAVGFVEFANGHLIRAMKAFLSKEKTIPLPRDRS